MIAEQAQTSSSKAQNEPDWDAIERSPDFQALIASKWKFMIPASIFFLAYYFALPILTGYAPDLMKTPVIGSINLANLFALSQFVMVGAIIALYAAKAKSYDAQAAAIVARVRNSK